MSGLILSCMQQRVLSSTELGWEGPMLPLPQNLTRFFIPIISHTFQGEQRPASPSALVWLQCVTQLSLLGQQSSPVLCSPFPVSVSPSLLTGQPSQAAQLSPSPPAALQWPWWSLLPL